MIKYLVIGTLVVSLLAIQPLFGMDRHILEQEMAWELVKDEEGVKVYLGDWSGSDFVAFRSETEFEFSFRDLLKLIRDIGAYKEWMPDCEASRVVEKESENAFIYYVSMNSPWPVTDRDWVNRLEIESNPVSGVITVIYRAAPGVLPEEPDFIRINQHYALWILTPLGENRVHSVWYGHSEPEGWIPGWLARYTIDQMILDTTLNMKNHLENRKE